MIRNYFKIAIRNLLRHRAFSIVNITGLGIGIASCIILFTVIKHELSYDHFQPNYNNIFHVVTQDKNSEGLSFTPGIPFPALEALRLEYHNVKSGALLANYGSQVTVLNNNNSTELTEKKFIESSGFFFADPQFFEVFSYEWLKGSSGSLKDPNKTVLTRATAKKYFGEWQSAIGRYLKLDNAVTVQVVGILNDIPESTDFPLSIVTSYETAKQNPDVYFYTDQWGATTSNFQIFLSLPEDISAASFNSRLSVFSNKYYGERKRSERLNFLQPLSDVHYDGRFENFGDHITRKSVLWTLGLIGVFILLMACINFINLSTAQAANRSKEIGIRKVLGGFRRQLFQQVLSETFLIVLVAVILGFCLAYLMFPVVGKIVSVGESSTLFTTETFIFGLFISVMVTILSGVYPAFVLSKFNPVLAIKNKITSASVGGVSLRKALVVLQFAISQVLVIGTLVAISQMSFIKNADIGFNKEAVLLIDVNTDSIVQSRQPAFKQQLLSMPGIKAVSFSSDVPSSDNNSATNFSYNHLPDADFAVFTKFADEDYFKTFELNFLAGNSFKKSDTINEVVVNETLMKKLNVSSPSDMLGKEIRFGRGEWKKICGVVKDFNTNSLKENIKPLAIAANRKYYQVSAIKFQSENIAKTKSAVESSWNKFFPEYAYTVHFMDEKIAEFYKQDEALSSMYKIFAGIAIFISCLGLYGLISFMAVQKTKEIGIRKVLGASVKNILMLFSKEFTWLIIIGFLVAVPVAWYMMNLWLQNFEYKVTLTLPMFLSAILISLLVAWLAVGYTSFKAAFANPVKSLRNE